MRNGFMPVKQFRGTLTQTPPLRTGHPVHRRPMLFHRKCAARFSFNDGFGSFHATDIAFSRMKVKPRQPRPPVNTISSSPSRWGEGNSSLAHSQQFLMFGLHKFRRHLHSLAGRDRQIFACGPDFVVDQQLERDRVFRHPGPAPCLGVHTDQWHSTFPGQAAALASQEDGIAKTDISFDVNGDECRARPGGGR